VKYYQYVQNRVIPKPGALSRILPDLYKCSNKCLGRWNQSITSVHIHQSADEKRMFSYHQPNLTF